MPGRRGALKGVTQLPNFFGRSSRSPSFEPLPSQLHADSLWRCPNLVEVGGTRCYYSFVVLGGSPTVDRIFYVLCASSVRLSFVRRLDSGEIHKIYKKDYVLLYLFCVYRLTHLSLLSLALPRTVLLLSSLLLSLLGTSCRVLLISILFSVSFCSLCPFVPPSALRKWPLKYK